MCLRYVEGVNCIQFTQDVVWSHKMQGMLYEMSHYQLLNDTTQCFRWVSAYRSSWQHVAALSTNSNDSSVFLCTYDSKWNYASCVDYSLCSRWHPVYKPRGERILVEHQSRVRMSVIPTILNRYIAIKTTPSRGKRFFAFPKCPDSLRALLNLLSVGTGGFFPRHKREGVKMMTHLGAVLWLRVSGAIPQLPQHVFMVWTGVPSLT